MRIDIVTLFPEFFGAGLASGVVGRAVESGRVDIRCIDPRDFTTDRHRTVDDYAYGGGPGMILKAPPLVEAVESAVGSGNPEQVPVVLLSPQGERFTQAVAHEMAGWPRCVLVCGRYKAIDERFRELVVTRELSIGDFVLSGGEPGALVVLDAVLRLVPGVLGDEDSAESDSFGVDGSGGLDCAYYTRPAEYRGRAVPEVLISGHHARIEAWRREQGAARTRTRRPDLVVPAPPASQRSGRRGVVAAPDARPERPADEPGPTNSTWRQAG